MLTVETAIYIACATLAATGITRPSASVQPVQVVVVGKAQVPVVQTTVYSAAWCMPCKPYIKGLKDPVKGMPVFGWVLREATDKDASAAHVIFTHDESEWNKLEIWRVPCTVIRKNGVEVERFYGGVIGDTLSEKVNAIGNATPQELEVMIKLNEERKRQERKQKKDRESCS